MKFTEILKRLLKPTVRQVAAFATLAVALPRLPIWPWPVAFAQLKWFSPEVFGWMTFGGGLALLITGNKMRYRSIGRIIALTGFFAWGLLASATSSATSMLIDFVIMWILLSEVTAERYSDDCD